MKKKIRFNSQQLEYTVQIKRRKNLWWLLLLLLPLLLLIRFEKDISIKTVGIGSKVPIPGTEVQFSYIKRYAYDKGAFFTNNLEIKQGITDEQGLVHFSGLGFSLYSWLFHSRSEAIILAKNNCYGSDTLIRRFHGLSDGETVEVILSPVMLHLGFTVADKDDRQPLPGATVIIRSADPATNFIDSAVSGADGKVVFSVPKCGKIAAVVASAEGYYPDSIINATSEILLSDNANRARIFYLRPIKTPITFYVEDCITRVGLAGAKATIDFSFAHKPERESKEVITNINGVGKGVYDSAKVVAKLHIRGEKEFYKNGELPGWHSVKDFTNNDLYDKRRRTFCLEPEPNPIVLINIDSLSGDRLPNVKNIITIKRGDSIITKEVLSNAQGEVPLSINPGDIISVHAQYPPGYKDNDHTIKNVNSERLIHADEATRTIPLTPIMVELTFRTVEADNLGQPVPEATLQISRNGLVQPLPVKSDASGSFTVKAALLSRISIIASKAGYGHNDDKILNSQVEALASSPQSARDIPLRILPPPCLIKQSAGKEGTFVEEYNMGSRELKFQILYNLFTKPDRLTVRCGRKNDPNGKILYQTIGYASGIEVVPIDMSECDTEWITIEVIADRAGTEWKYEFICP